MKRIILLAAASIASCALLQGVAAPRTPSGINKEEFGKTMRELWTDHVVWTRQYIVDAAADLPSLSFSEKRLMRNQEDIGTALVPFYGRSSANKLTALLKEHIKQAGELIGAAKKGNMKLYNLTDEKWHKNAKEISTFLSKANPHITEEDMTAEMFEHLKLTADEAGARIKKNWAEDVTAYDAVRKQINGMADMLTQAIIAQFPNKFQK